MVERAPCSHSIAVEERWMSALGADKIVASVVRRPDHHVMRGEYAERTVQDRRRQVWAVAVECDDVLPAVSGEVLKHGGGSGGEPFTSLRPVRSSMARPAP